MLFRSQRHIRNVSWSTYTRGEEREAGIGGGHAGTKDVHRGAYAVRHPPFAVSLTCLSKVVMPFPIVARAHRIWNTYKNEFAKARLRELSIID